MRSVAWWVVAWIATGAGFVIALITPNAWLPSARLGLRSYQVPIQPEMTVSQTFVMTADGLYAIEFAPAAIGNTASGTLRIELHEQGSGVVRSEQVSALDLIASPTHRFTFEPIDDSKDSSYRLDLRSSESRPVNGIAVWATKGERSGGAMLINDRERWANLAFRTFAPVGRSAWGRVTGLQSGFRGPLVIAALAGYWLALGVVLRALSRRES